MCAPSLRAIPRLWCLVVGIATFASVITGCGSADSPLGTLAYNIWSGNGSVPPDGGEDDDAEGGDGTTDPSGTPDWDEVEITGAGGGPAVVAGETEERGDSPILQVSVQALNFGESGTQLSFEIYNAGDGTMEYTIAADQPWISVDPDGGANEGTLDEIVVQVDRTGLPSGAYAGIVAVATADGQDEQIDVWMAVAAAPPPADDDGSAGGGDAPPPDAPSEPDEPTLDPPAYPSDPARAAYFFWDWNTDAAQINAFVPLLVGHYSSMCVVFIGLRPRVETNLEYVLSIPHPAEVIVGLSTAEMLNGLEDIEGWHALGSLAAWCVARTGVPRLNLDLEWDADDYIYGDIPLDFDKLETGLRAFASYIPDVHVYFYPPNWEGITDESRMRAVLRRTRLIEAARRCLPNFHAMGASVASYGSYLKHAYGAEYRALEALWSVPPGPVEQIMLFSDEWWSPDLLRPILPTIPRECWLYVEPPYNAQKANRLIQCLEE